MWLQPMLNGTLVGFMAQVKTLLLMGLCLMLMERQILGKLYFRLDRKMAALIRFCQPRSLLNHRQIAVLPISLLT